MISTMWATILHTSVKDKEKCLLGCDVWFVLVGPQLVHTPRLLPQTQREIGVLRGGPRANVHFVDWDL